LIGLGAGGLAGAGLGNSVQKLFFLPQEHTDFILAVIGEEAGLLGTAAIIFLFLALLWLGYRVFMKTDDLFGKFLALGITLIITTQAIMHTAVVTASIPNKGISLPFISFGGSAIFMMTLSVGILINIAKQSEKTVSS
ncbi:MAG: FtsW/RodA/SpoVE family cell cycle protein, partial [Planctomycetota bacterium]